VAGRLILVRATGHENAAGRGTACQYVRSAANNKEVGMKDKLYLGAIFCFLAGVILIVISADGRSPVVIGLTAGSGICYLASALLLTIRRRRGPE